MAKLGQTAKRAGSSLKPEDDEMWKVVEIAATLWAGHLASGEDDWGPEDALGRVYGLIMAASPQMPSQEDE